MTERPPGTVPSKHTFVKKSVLLTGVMIQEIRSVQNFANCEISRKIANFKDSIIIKGIVNSIYRKLEIVNSIYRKFETISKI